MGKDPERDRRRQEEADSLGITPEELRARRKAEQDTSLEKKAEEHGVTVDQYVAEHRKKKRGGRPYKGPQPAPKATGAPES
ncbi:MAG TPA: hypothetical protein VIT24_12695 [Acidimicrobiales bacterium]